MTSVVSHSQRPSLRPRSGRALRHFSAPKTADLVFLPIILGFFLTVAGGFARHQTLWLDEVTQLAGIGLGPIGVTRWLAGSAHTFGWAVAPDRMPPLSYYYQQAWAMLVGAGDVSLRWSGITCGVAAIVLIHAIGRRAYGARAAIVAAAVGGLATAVIERTVEIRAYPLYLLFATAALYAAVRHVQAAAGHRWLILATVLACATFWTQFQGLVFATGLLLAVALHHRTQRRSLAPPIAALGAVAAAFVAAAPFISHSLEVSRRGAHFTFADNLASLQDLCWSLVGQRINLDVPWLAVLSVAGAVLALGAGLRAHLAAGKAVLPVTRALLCVAGFQVVTVLTACLAITAFRPGAFQYNLPLVPSLAVLFASTVTVSDTTCRRLALAGVALLLACHVTGGVRMVTEGYRMAHGVDVRIVQTVERLGVDNVVVIHEAGSNGADVQAYYPLAYFLGGHLTQYLYSPQTRSFRRQPDKKPTDPVSLQVPHVIVVRSGVGNAFRSAATAPVPMDRGPAVDALGASPDWRLARSFTYDAYFKMTTWVFDRVSVPAVPPKG
jgi:hypothetical protein